MRYKKIAAFLLAAALTCNVVGTTVFASAPSENVAESEAASVLESILETVNDEENASKQSVSVSMSAVTGATYGEPCSVTVTTDPADVQYVGVIAGTSGKASGNVYVVLPEKVRILLKMIPLPSSMSSSGSESGVFSVYAYAKQLIDGTSVKELLKVAEEISVLLEAMEYYVPDLQGVGSALKSGINLADKYLPNDLETHVYLDEDPTEAGRYLMGAVTVDSKYVNTSAIKTFTIKQKTDGVRAEWNEEIPSTMTTEQAAQTDFTAKVYDNDTEVEDSVTYLYTGWSGWWFYRSTEAPTKAGRYTQKAYANGNYKSETIRRSFRITN
jgi:hypothetical protein